MASLKLFLTVLAVSVPGLILCIAKLVDVCKWSCTYTDLVKVDNLHLMQSTD